jgi:peptide/nickel transport system permease protein
LIYLVVFIAVVNIIFFLPRLAPGNAADILAGNTRLPSVAVVEISERLGLNKPLYYQYTTFWKNVLLNFPPYLGVSYDYYPVSVSYLVAVRAGWSFLLILTSFAIGQLMTYAAAAVSALRRGGKFETGTLYSLITFNSVPLFWFSMVLLYAFAIYLHVFPLFGNVSLTAAPGTPAYYESIIWHMILPVVALSISLMGESYLILRGSMQDSLKSDYVLSARSRGLTNWMISSGYVLRNSLLPLVSVMSFSTASLLSRLILIEAVFVFPGLGDLLVDGVLGRDYPVITGELFYLTLIVILGGIIGDVLLVRLDPRLRTAK